MSGPVVILLDNKFWPGLLMETLLVTGDTLASKQLQKKCHKCHRAKLKSVTLLVTLGAKKPLSVTKCHQKLATVVTLSDKMSPSGVEAKQLQSVTKGGDKLLKQKFDSATQTSFYGREQRCL